MSKIITDSDLEKFKKDGAILIKGKFNSAWIEKLRKEFKMQKIILALDL